MDIVSTYIGIVGTAAAAIMWLVHTVRHRRHLAQCEQDLRRQRRLDRRLVGCITEMEWLLDRMPAQATSEDVPEELVGHARYLYGLRQEATDNAVRLGVHAVRLRWPDGYMGKVTLAGRRCELAHGALMEAFQALADATREYERGLGPALLKSGDGAKARSMAMPVRLLDEPSAEEVAKLRQKCERALTRAAYACKVRVPSHVVFEARWPVRRSEVSDLGAEADPYMGEIRPVGWRGFGAQPLLHVDAR